MGSEWLDGDPRVEGAPVEDWARADLDRIDGGFAVAWRVGPRLFLARDAIGHRSLYWARRWDGEVVYGSRLQDVVRKRGERVQVCLPAVATYLCYAYVPGGRTLVEGVYAVPPGTVQSFAEGAPAGSRDAWSLPPDPPSWDAEEELRPRLRAVLEEAVGRAVDGVAACAFLSGGIDSSLVLALARRLSGAPIPALSVSFGPGHANELEWSSLVARHCGVEHRVLEIAPGDVRTRFDATVQVLSEPNGDPLTVPNAMLFSSAARDCRVVLNGEGGDPCFGGPKNAPMLLAELYGEGAREQAYLAAHQRCWPDLSEMLDERVPTGHLVPDLTRPFTDPRWTSYLSRLMAMNILHKAAWHILPKVEHLGGCVGVEARSPLFDRRVVEFSTLVPAALKRQGAVEKHLLKEAVRDLLPASVVERPKSGMMVPVEAWFEGPLRAWARERLLDGLAPRQLVRRDWLERLVDRGPGGLRPRRGIKIWLLLTLESWLRGVGA